MDELLVVIHAQLSLDLISVFIFLYFLSYFILFIISLTLPRRATSQDALSRMAQELGYVLGL